MKKTFLIAFMVCSVVAASSAMAHQPAECGGPPAHAGPPGGPPGQSGTAGSAGKATILHCACNEVGDRMEYVEIRISSRSRGHLKHVAGSIDSCAPEGSEEFSDFVRVGSDCQLDGPSLGEDIAACTDQIAGQECGTGVID